MSQGKRLALAVVALIVGIAVGNVLFTAVLPVPSWVQTAYGVVITVAFMSWGLDSRATE